MHDDDELPLDFPNGHSVHSLSAAVALRLWSRYLPAAQPAHGLTVGPWAAVLLSYVVRAGQTSHRVMPFVNAKVRFGQILQPVLCGGGWGVELGCLVSGAGWVGERSLCVPLSLSLVPFLSLHPPPPPPAPHHQPPTHLPTLSSYLPSGHCAQTELAALLAKVPAAQTRHCEAEVSPLAPPKVPTGQAPVQFLPPATL